MPRRDPYETAERALREAVRGGRRRARWGLRPFSAAEDQHLDADCAAVLVFGRYLPRPWRYPPQPGRCPGGTLARGARGSGPHAGPWHGAFGAPGAASGWRPRMAPRAARRAALFGWRHRAAFPVDPSDGAPKEPPEATLALYARWFGSDTLGVRLVARALAREPPGLRTDLVNIVKTSDGIRALLAAGALAGVQVELRAGPLARMLASGEVPPDALGGLTSFARCYECNERDAAAAYAILASPASRLLPPAVASQLAGACWRSLAELEEAIDEHPEAMTPQIQRHWRALLRRSKRLATILLARPLGPRT